MCETIMRLAEDKFVKVRWHAMYFAPKNVLLHCELCMYVFSVVTFVSRRSSLFASRSTKIGVLVPYYFTLLFISDVCMLCTFSKSVTPNFKTTY